MIFITTAPYYQQNYIGQFASDTLATANVVTRGWATGGGNPKPDMFYYNTVSNTFLFWNGSAWTAFGGGSAFVGFKAYNAGNQTIVAGAYRDLEFDTDVYDIGTFRTNHQLWTIPAGKGGYYRITCQAYINIIPAVTELRLVLLIDSAYQALIIEDFALSQNTMTIVDTVFLNAGQTISFQARSSVWDVNVQGGAVYFSRICVEKVG